MSNIIGLIAEDDSDAKVIHALIKMMSRNQRFKVKKHLGRGSGRIAGKCKQWAMDLKNRGCTYLILVRDLDHVSPQERQIELRKALGTCPILRHVIIVPIQEIEAWLLADSNAIKRAMNLTLLPKEISSPESVRNPKSKLSDVIYRCSENKTRYVNTIHNEKIASELRVSKIRRCTSFLNFESFVQGIFA
jgi:hypothetical protein